MFELTKKVKGIYCIWNGSNEFVHVDSSSNKPYTVNRLDLATRFYTVEQAKKFASLYEGDISIYTVDSEVTFNQVV